jgi:hypothetical protein
MPTKVSGIVHDYNSSLTGGSQSEFVAQLQHDAEAIGKSTSRLENLAKKCLVGYGQMDVSEGEVQIRFGKWNYRPLNTTEGNRLYDSMISNGIQRFRLEHAIPLVVPPEYVDPESLSMDSLLGDQLPKVRWTAAGLKAGNVEAAGGRHRKYAVQRFRGKLESDAARAHKQAEALKKRGETSDRYLQALERAKEKDKMAGESSNWMVSVYDLGKPTAKDQ